jgi:hypothetical protein
MQEAQKTQNPQNPQNPKKIRRSKLPPPTIRVDRNPLKKLTMTPFLQVGR